MSIDASVATFEHEGRKINLIDTPGEPSFVADAVAALRVADAAVVVINAATGVEVHTERLWRRADDEGLARLVFVNMLDRERADFFAALDSLKRSFGAHVVATEIPIGTEQDVRGVVDLIDMKAFVSEGTGRDNATEVEIPDELRAQAEEYREKLMDEVAENSDELMERYLDGEEIDHEEIVGVLKQGVTEGRIFPVTCGVATRNLGTGRLLSALVEDLPSPAMRGAIEARRRRGRGDRDRARRGGAAGRLRLQDPRRPLHGEDQPLPRLPRDAGLGLAHRQLQPPPEGAGRPARPAARQGPDAGDRARRRRHRRRRQAEGDPGRGRPHREPGGDLLPAARPAGAGDGVRLRAALEGRRGEGGGRGPAAERGGPDPRRPSRRPDRRADRRRPDPDPRRGPGRADEAPLRRRDRAPPAAGSLPGDDPDRAAAHARYKKQSGGRGQFADCKIEIEPAEEGVGLEFVNRIKGASIPGSFIPAVEKGVVEAMEHGTVAGYPGQRGAGDARRRQTPRRRLLRDGVQDRRLDGLPAGDGGGRAGPARADRQAHRQLPGGRRRRHHRRPQLAPRPSAGDGAVGGDDRGQGRGADGRGPRLRARTCASISGGRADFTMDFERYDEVPAHLADRVVAATRESTGAAV